MKFLFTLIFFTLLYMYSFAQDFGREQNFRIAASGGYAYRVGKKPGNQQYYKDVSHGPAGKFDATYFFNQRSGIGLSYSLFSTSGSGTFAEGSVLSNIRIHYIGPAYHTQTYTSNKNFIFLSGISIGYMMYRDAGWVNDNYGVIKGASVGALLQAGFDARLVKGLYAGLDVNIYGGSLSSITRNGTKYKLDDKSKESLTRIEATTGLRYRF